jgi:hypothetical protein
MVFESSMMKSDKQELILTYLLKIKSINKKFNKKEIFKDLLYRFSSGDKEIGSIRYRINKIPNFGFINKDES